MMSDKNQKVVIIGAGVIGLATAYELLKRGFEVTVVEEKEPGWAASHGNAGMIYPAAGEPMVNPKHTKAGIGWMLTRGGQSPLQFSWSQVPGLMNWGMKALGACNNTNYVEGKKAFDMLGADTHKLFDEYKKDGIKYEEFKQTFLAAFIHKKEFNHLSQLYGQDPANEVLSGDEARDREPFLSEKVVGAVEISGGFSSVLPGSVCVGLAKKIQELGGEINTGIKVIGANHADNKIESLQTENGQLLTAEHYIVAAGGWSGKLSKVLGSKVPITGGKGYAITIDEPSVCPNQTVFLSEYEAVVVPFNNSIRFTGFLELSGVNMELRKKRFKSLRQVVSRYAKQLPDGKEVEEWTGMRACSPDGIPIIGNLPGLKNAWIGSGHWHFGLTLAPSTAVMLAELITEGKSSVESAPFDPGRF